MKRKASLFVFNYIYLILMILPFLTIFDTKSGCNGWNYGMVYHAPIPSLLFILIDLGAFTFNLLVLANIIFKDSLIKKYEKGNKISYRLNLIFFIIVVLLFVILFLYSIYSNRLPSC